MASIRNQCYGKSRINYCVRAYGDRPGQKYNAGNAAAIAAACLTGCESKLLLQAKLTLTGLDHQFCEFRGIVEFLQSKYCVTNLLNLARRENMIHKFFKLFNHLCF